MIFDENPYIIDEVSINSKPVRQIRFDTADYLFLNTYEEFLSLFQLIGIESKDC